MKDPVRITAGPSNHLEIVASTLSQSELEEIGEVWDSLEIENASYQNFSFKILKKRGRFQGIARIVLAKKSIKVKQTAKSVRLLYKKIQIEITKKIKNEDSGNNWEGGSEDSVVFAC